MKSRQSPSTKNSQQKLAVIYARVSSKDQEKDGYSIPAQLKLLKEYAENNGVEVVREFLEVESAKQDGRIAFGEMTAWLQSKPDVHAIFVEKTDRLYRNLKDYVTLDELGVEIHFVKEGEVLSEDSHSSSKFLHGIKVLMAKNYIDNLAEEVRKGLQEKAEQGIWPTLAPIGYMNITGPDGRKIIAVDPHFGPIVARLFEWYATGEHSLTNVARKIRAEGLVQRRTGAPLPIGAVRRILENKIYAGSFNWRGRLYQGNHEPLVSVELWEKVQLVRKETVDGRYRQGKHEFTFTKLMRCTSCGNAVVAEIKKGKYIYYHCTGHDKRNPEKTRACRRKHVREEAVEQQFTDLLGQLRLDDEVFRWIRETLLSGEQDWRRERDAAYERLKGEHDRLQEKMQVVYVDKLEGKIDNDFFERMADKIKDDLARCKREMERLRQQGQCNLENGLKIVELAQNACFTLSRLGPVQKRQLLKFLLSNFNWDDGKVRCDFRYPFDIIAKNNALVTASKMHERSNFAKIDIWDQA